MLASTVIVFVAAFSSPLLSPEWRAVLMRVFAPVCHQLPDRSPHLAGVQAAICDRCTGIYFGLVVGVASVRAGSVIWRYIKGYGRYVLLGSLVPLGLDWAGPVFGLWSNGPLSRFGTGFLFGIIAASFVAYRLLRNVLSDR